MWAEHNSHEEDVDSVEEDVDSDDDRIQHFQEIATQVPQRIKEGQHFMAMYYFELTNANNPYNVHEIVDLIRLTVQFNTMHVFDHIVRTYQNSIKSELNNDSEDHQKQIMFIALSNDSLPSTLLHLIRHTFFVNLNTTWFTSFSVLFHLTSTLPSLEDMLLQSEAVLSKLKIIFENGANPRRRNYDRYYYSGFDEFTEWCVYTNATDDTIHRGFNILLEHARDDAIFHDTVFDIVSLFSENILRIICMNQHHTDKDGRPTINIQECSEKSPDSVLRMMMFFKGSLRFPIDKVGRNRGLWRI